MYTHMKKRHEVEFSLNDFHDMFLGSGKFSRLMKEWAKSRYDKQLKPSIDRIDCRGQYCKENIHMMTWAENRFKQSKMDGKRGRKPAVLQMLGNRVIRRFDSQRHAVKELGISQGNLSTVLTGKRQTTAGYRFIYENPELLEKTNE